MINAFADSGKLRMIWYWLAEQDTWAIDQKLGRPQITKRLQWLFAINRPNGAYSRAARDHQGPHTVRPDFFRIGI